MKPRTAAATYIIAAIAAALSNKTALYEAGQAHKQKRHKPLTDKQKRRIDDITSRYLDVIKQALADADIDGDFAEVAGISRTVDTGSQATASDAVNDPPANAETAQLNDADYTDEAIHDHGSTDPDVGREFDPLDLGSIRFGGAGQALVVINHGELHIHRA